MFEEFTNHSELKWMATVAPQFFSGGDKFQVNPDLVNFKLERFVDLRKQPVSKKGASAKLMLIGSSRTNIFVDGPETLVDILVTKLPSYVGESWSEILDIRLERSLLNCENFLVDGKCDPWVIDKFELKEITGRGQKTPYTTSADFTKADEICAKCSNFMESKKI